MSLNKIVNDFVKSSGKDLGTDGFIRLEDGMIIQWGQHGIGSSSGGIGTFYNFPLAFPTACLSITGTPVTVWDSDSEIVQYGNVSKTQFEVSGDASRYIAVGY